MVMFEIGQYIVKANTGVCRVTEIISYSLSEEEEKKDYYRLDLCGGKKGTVLVPLGSEKSNMRPVMTKEEAECLLSGIPEIAMMKITSERQREQEYKEAIKANDPNLLVAILKELYQRNRIRESEGKKVTALDDRYVKMAEAALFEEISVVLAKDGEELRRLILADL